MFNKGEKLSFVDFKALKDGTKVRVVIHGYSECEGAISVERNNKFICTNTANGCMTSDRLGFKYSWQATQGNISLVKSLTVLTDEELYSIF